MVDCLNKRSFGWRLCLTNTAGASTSASSSNAGSISTASNTEGNTGVDGRGTYRCRHRENVQNQRFQGEDGAAGKLCRVVPHLSPAAERNENSLIRKAMISFTYPWIPTPMKMPPRLRNILKGMTLTGILPCLRLSSPKP